jgi:hypothetical protein
MKVSSAVIALRYGLRGYFAFLTLWNTHFHRTSVPAKLNVGYGEGSSKSRPSGVGRQLPDATVLDGEQLRICSLFALFQMSSLIFATFSITECFSPACMSP